MKISLEIEANSDEFEQIIRTIIFGQISDEDLKKAKQREAEYKHAERAAYTTKLIVDAYAEQCEKWVVKAKNEWDLRWEFFALLVILLSNDHLYSAFSESMPDVKRLEEHWDWHNDDLIKINDCFGSGYA